MERSAAATVPVMTVCAPSLIGTLATGSTFFSFTTDAAIRIIRVSTTIGVIGIIGGGDAVKCNDSTGAGLGATSSAGAAVGTLTQTTGSVAISSLTTVSCHLDSTATTRPILNACLSYVMQ